MTREALAPAMMAEAGPAPSGLPRAIVATGASAVFKALDPDDAVAKVNAGYRLVRYKDFGGKPAVKMLPPLPPEPRPRLLLVEVYRLSSYLGAYGAGRVLKTFTLLPGEKTKISVKTYTRRTTDAKAASSILDSFTKESAEDFEKSTELGAVRQADRSRELRVSRRGGSERLLGLGKRQGQRRRQGRHGVVTGGVRQERLERHPEAHRQGLVPSATCRSTPATR